MDLLATLRSKINSLREGEHSSGLRAVLLHIETAFGHLRRGHEENEDTAFTDAIYRTNLAFEGSIKEAYRLLAGKEPAKKRPFDIEKYLENNKIFRPRVLAQFTTYRTEWRNTSIHDYKLDFDESEAFLAIISVSAFACLLLDQMAERQSYEDAKQSADVRKEEITERLPKKGEDLLERATAALTEFSRQAATEDLKQPKTEIQVLGALCGFLASTAPDINLTADFRLKTDCPERGDLLLSKNDERVLVELKRSPKHRSIISSGLAQLENYLMLSGIKKGVLFLFMPGRAEVHRTDHSIEQRDAKIVVLSPQKPED